MEDSVAVQDVKTPDRGNALRFEESQISESEHVRYLHHSQQLLSLFPKEVWDHICSFLDSNSFYNLNNSSPFFQQLFSRKRVRLLYQPIFDILLKKYIEIEADNSQRSSTLVSGMQPKSLPFLGTNRLVCKTWKRAIDKLASMRKSGSTGKTSETHIFLCEHYEFTNCEITNKLSTFAQHFNKTHPSSVNPFVGKFLSVTLIYQVNSNFFEISTQISTILEKYGHHLQSCELEFGLLDANEPEPLRIMLKWLTYMKNLKTLTIQIHFDIESNNEPNFNKILVPLEGPKCLEKLFIRTEHKTNWSCIEYCNFGQLVSVQEKLEYLHLDIYNESDIQILNNIKSPLKHLEVYYFRDGKDFDLLDIFKSYSKIFCSSLESVSLSFRGNLGSLEYIKIMHDSINGRFNLPKVRKFEFTFPHFLYSLDFLLGMQECLEELLINCSKGIPAMYKKYKLLTPGPIESEKSRNELIIEFMEYEEKMLESNIWNLFPKLEYICLTVDEKRMKYKRKDWVKSQKICKK